MLEIPVIPDNAPFDAEQRLWLNGYLAGYFSGRAPLTNPVVQSAPAAQVPLRILFGSQTGTAQNLAKRLAKDALTQGFKVQVTDAVDHAGIRWSEQSNLLIVTSTYGDGDMPDNMQGFWEWLQTDTATALKHVRFSVLALGDRNYAEFCAAGKKIDLRLEQLGAVRVHPRTDCDVDYEASAKSWMTRALQALQERSEEGSKPATAEAVSHDVMAGSLPALNGHRNGHSQASSKHSKDHPFGARLLRNMPLTKPGSAKEVRHYEISLHGSELSYAAGDALGVLPVNCPELVDDLLAPLGCSGKEPTAIATSEMPLRDAFARHLDITKPSPELLAAVAQRFPESELATLLQPERRDDLKQWLWGKGVIDILLSLPQPIPAAELVTLLKRLGPRLYSIASSPHAHPGEVHLTVNTVRYQSCGRNRKGVASTFLADRLGAEDDVKVFVQASHFKPPADDSRPMIMVGPGTGIAPFRAFLEERQVRGAQGKHWLFFGDQKRETDFLYEEQLTKWLHCGHLTKLDLAFSRDQAEKVYVQHRMLDNAAELWSWLEEGAHFYVCGDAARMAKDVDAALHQVAEKGGGLSPENAMGWVNRLRSEKRYQRDVY